MTLLRMVADMVTERGSATCDELLLDRRLVGCTRKQILHALKNARKEGLIHCMGRAPRLKVGTGSDPARHYPGARRLHVVKVMPKKAPPASVWELGEDRTRVWPPVGEGRKFNLLGEWDAA